MGNFSNPVAVKEVLTGKRKTANAAWWGFDKNDSTNALQEAINSGASKVIIPYMGSDWIARPLRLQSNQEIYFEPGVVVTAKKGEFKARKDKFFLASKERNITLIGYGATIRMQKKDYMSPIYPKLEYRHALAFYGCTNIKVYGLTLRDSGGDGIYVGASDAISCKDVEIKDCICDNNYRQGLSVVAVENLLVENCVFKNTNGTPPSAGIDIEPNREIEKLVNIVISNCVSLDNAGSGITVYLRKLSAKSPDVTVLFVNCFVQGCKYGFAIGAIKDDGPKGLIEFKNCSVENTKYAGAWILDKSATRANLKFSNCKWRNVATQKSDSEKTMSVPIHFYHRKKIPIKKLGGVEFSDCYIYDEKARPFLLATESESGIYDITGDIYICNPKSMKMELRPKNEGVSLKAKYIVLE